jgi:hypothetical protein
LCYPFKHLKTPPSQLALQCSITIDMGMERWVMQVRVPLIGLPSYIRGMSFMPKDWSELLVFY